MVSLANPTLRSVVKTSQDCGLKMACSLIPILGMKGIQVVPLRPMGLSRSFHNFIFTERGEIVAYNGVGKLDWGFGLAGAEAVVTGSDVLVMRGDKIGALYAFVDPPKK
jgi:hypothetical protein